MKNSKSLLVTALFVLAFQITNLTVIGPGLAQLRGESIGNLVYVALRVWLILGFSFLATRRLGLNRFRTIAWTSLLEFLAQVPAKGVWIHSLAQHDPVQWGNPEFGTLAMGLTMAYALFFPLVFGLSFLGAELGSSELGIKLLKKRVVII